MRRPFVLLGDIGGTNARFALARHDKIERRATLSVAGHATPLEAIGEFLKDLPAERRPRAAALACAGPVEDGMVAMTNSPWRIDAREIERHFGFAPVLLVNDFVAQAWAVPRLDAGALHAVGGGAARAERPAVVLGPGTGLGVAGYLPPYQGLSGGPSLGGPSGGPAVIVGEGGHVTMAAGDDREASVLALLRASFGHVSAERAISGDGLVRLYETIAILDETAVPRRDAAEIAAAATAGRCPTCAAALDMFCAMLGTLAGNLALTLGAAGGVYIGGGMVPRFAGFLAASRFRRRFEAKGRFQAYLAAIPTWIVTHPEPAFLGLTHLLAEER